MAVIVDAVAVIAAAVTGVAADVADLALGVYQGYPRCVAGVAITVPAARAVLSRRSPRCNAN